ncbi:MAG TPA: polysaccharide deacetylase family protein [Longimicrobiales bacterium]
MISNIQNRVSNGIYRLLFVSGAARFLRRSDAVVFCYHNVIPDEMLGRAGDPYLHISLSEFSNHLDWITSAYRIVEIGEILSRLRNGQPVAGLAALTFDDGYAGAVRYGVPVLRSADLPFALFPVIEAAATRRPFWWDLFECLGNQDRLRYLADFKGSHSAIVTEVNGAKDLCDDALPAGWSELKAVLADDCTVGLHTVTHRNLAVLAREEIRWELENSRACVESELGRTASIVCYPYGLSNELVEKETERAGFEAGLGLGSQMVRHGTSVFNVPRINVPAGIALASLACWSSGLKLRR